MRVSEDGLYRDVYDLRHFRGPIEAEAPELIARTTTLAAKVRNFRSLHLEGLKSGASMCRNTARCMGL